MLRDRNFKGSNHVICIDDDRAEARQNHLEKLFSQKEI